jgi:hypothetical protein
MPGCASMHSHCLSPSKFSFRDKYSPPISANSPLFWNPVRARAPRSRCPLYRKRDSQDSALYFVESPLSVF